MPFEVAPGPLLGALSGIAVIGLGSATLLVRPLPRPAAAFGFLALLWGLQVTVANTAEGFTDPPTKLLWINATVALAILVAAALAVVVLAWRAPAGAFRPVALLPVALAGAALEAALFLEPGLFVRGLSLEPGLPVATGPLFLPVITGANIVAFTVALAVLGERFRRPLPPVAREQFSLVIAALVAYVSYRAGEAFDFLLYANAYVALDGSGGYAFELAAALLAAGVLAGVLAVVLPRPDLPWRDLHVVVAIVPLAVAVGQSLLGAPQGATAGVWRLVMVALFAYAIARYRLFDIEVRLGQLAPALAYAGIAGAGLAVLWVAAWPTLTAVPLLGLVASAGVAAACAPAARLGPWIKHRAAPHLAEPDYLYKRKVDVYRAALEEAQGRGMGDATEQAFLSDLRRRLGISEQEHRLLTLIVQAQSRYGPRAPTPGMERFRVEKELGRGGFARALL
ncbi:MAG TPA: hypothetical protein VGR28_12575, partial [Candidatus Thermoplasmatota archaeon]|nr:hypothetical protein [Candidatus Thermoplasmatota archaeon]